MNTTQLNEIVPSKGCYFDPYAVCEYGLETPDSKLCAKCIAFSFADVVRVQL